MSGADEFTSTRIKSFDWRRLPEGEYKVTDNGEIVRLDDTVGSTADKVSAALANFAKSLE